MANRPAAFAAMSYRFFRMTPAVFLGTLAAACGGGGGGGATGTTTPAAVVVTATAPGAPTELVATAGNASATIAFAAPAANGGSAITGYSVTCVSGASSQAASGTASPITVAPLANNTGYACTATATNAIGASPASAPVSVTPLATIGAPGAPTLQSVTPANSSALLTFSAPASPGISPIIAYTATCTLGATRISATATASPVLLLGLANGSSYACSVTAANAVGAGPASGSLNVSPAASTATPAGVAQFTTLDFSTLVSYANPTLPPYYDATVTGLDNTPPNNTITDRGASLGRVLFYDKRLSINDTISCASCHRQASGFTDPLRFSTGFSGSAFTTAHAMRLGNIRYYRPGDMFWDRRAASVEIQATQPVQNAIEMGWTAAAGGIPSLITKLNATAYYPALFNFVFGTPAITEGRIQQALAQFERAMISSNSRWDTGYTNVFNNAAPNANLGLDLPNFTTEENRGRTLFINARNNGGAGCAACHIPPTFSLAANSQSNGLDAGETRIFKSPSLKNIGVTGPYMHDGRFATLAEVIEFYDHGVQAGPALDNRLKQGNGAPQVLNLPAADKAALVAFLRTLDDPVLNSDPRFASPMLQ
jgi:cytochrome c peroxidase